MRCSCWSICPRFFSQAALLVRQIFRRDNAFYICAGMHFFYNLMVFFVISI